MDFIRTSLEQQPLMAFFLTIAIGYLVGEINVKGFSLGVGAVLFVALAMGWFAPKAVPAPMLGTFGLALFLYAVGIQYGKQFVTGLTSSRGLKSNLAALTGVLVSGGLTLLFVNWIDISSGTALGLFAGAGTSTPALQAAMAATGTDDPAIGYSVAYPFGVAGPILFLYFGFLLLKPKIEAPPGAGMELLEIALRGHAGQRLADLAIPSGVRIVALRRDQRNRPPDAETVLAENDVLLAVSPSKSALDEAGRILGAPAPGGLVEDRRDLDYLRVFASRAAVIGRPLGELRPPGSVMLHVRRGDAELLPGPDLVLEFGDRVGVLARRDDFPALRAYFGDSIKGTAEFSYVSIGLGMAIGFMIGAIPIPIPGAGRVALGLSGVLITALLMGYRRRAAGLTWVLPAPANLVLRNLGLTLFLAQVGMSAGPKFAATVSETGFQLLGLGVIALVGLVLPILLLGLYAFRMPFDEVAGIVAGACGNPAILAYSVRLAPTERPDVAYATIFPGMTIVKILFVSLVPNFF